MLSAADAAERLSKLGYEVKTEDMGRLEVICAAAEEMILNYCGIDELPTELYNSAMEVVEGFYCEYIAGDDGGEVKSITEGDVSVSYDADARNERLKRMRSMDAFKRYRRLRW
jgi:hypothetical protein